MKEKSDFSYKLKTMNKKETGKTMLSGLVSYILLIGIGFVYLYPIIYMLLMSVMPNTDLINPTIQWIPTHLDFSSYPLVFDVLEYTNSFFTTFLIASVSSILQTVTCALVGYALARYQVPAKKLWIFFLLLIFIIPADVVSVPRYVLYNRYNLIGSLQSIFLPALLGQGLKSSLFILMFMQSFGSYPRSYDEAAQLDGAGAIKIFFQVAIPLAVPIIILSVLFSFIWYWNDTAQSSMFLSETHQTLPLQLDKFDSLYNNQYSSSIGSTANRLNERLQMTATILAISPLVLLYFAVQKGMISSIENAGITGE